MTHEGQQIATDIEMCDIFQAFVLVDKMIDAVILSYAQGTDTEANQ
jgi:hypothetical protein